MHASSRRQFITRGLIATATRPTRADTGLDASQKEEQGRRSMPPEGFGNVSEVLAEIAPRKVLIAAGVDEGSRAISSARIVQAQFTSDPRLFTTWLGD